MRKENIELFDIKKTNGRAGSIKGRFILSPFSVLDTKQGDWRSRNQMWKSLGIKSGNGRKDKLTFTAGFDHYRNTNGRARTPMEETTSIFDPVLCEMMYHWFCPAGGQIVDPFCGGSVRGLVASLMGYRYWGIDIRPEQIEANLEQYEKVCTGKQETPEWVLGDSVIKIEDAPKADFVFSCPPYGDLEKYSDDPKDLSNMTFEDFMKCMDTVIQGCYNSLRRNAFACFVISDYRDKNGNYTGFFPETIRSFQKAGFEWYNDIILVNTVGSLPLRITRQFNAGRKVGRMHQNVLIFIKGDPEIATEKIISSLKEE
jgi:DNA modification methylase